jgi:hypothetical protein
MKPADREPCRLKRLRKSSDLYQASRRSRLATDEIIVGLCVRARLTACGKTLPGVPKGRLNLADVSPGSTGTHRTRSHEGRLKSGAPVFSRPYGTVQLAQCLTQDLRPGLNSDVPSGLSRVFPQLVAEKIEAHEVNAATLDRKSGKWDLPFSSALH